MSIRADQQGLELLHDSNNLIVRRDGKALSTASTANTHTKAAGSTTAVFTNTTFDGSVGASGYTIGDIVLALKNIGILPQ